MEVVKFIAMVYIIMSSIAFIGFVIKYLVSNILEDEEDEFK